MVCKQKGLSAKTYKPSNTVKKNKDVKQNGDGNGDDDEFDP